jgi:uncharacterized protein YyaL (SSP411 family)
MHAPHRSLGDQLHSEVRIPHRASVCLVFIIAFGSSPGILAQKEDPLTSPGHRMGKESSTYLRQHQDDQVDWYPWGDEAFAKAKELGKPVFLSIGYSSCHWCHVMQRESFKSKEVAAVLNRVCVSIKLDREERPDVDTIYMDACHAMSVPGGWPLSAFLLPDRKPFLMRTYLPPEVFVDLLGKVETAYKERKGDLESYADRLTEALKAQTQLRDSTGLPDSGIFADAAQWFLEQEDKEHGGFTATPKFPLPSIGLFLLRHGTRNGSADGEEAVFRLLDALRRGGIRDHLAGGFHRYSTDKEWKVPHFEKMLFDQAMMSRMFLEGFLIRRRPQERHVLESTLDFCIRELRGKDGGFVAALDAEVDGIEGKSYVWSLEEIERILTKDESRVVRRWCGATTEGNWEKSRNVLYEALAANEVAAAEKLELTQVESLLASAKEKLLVERKKRVQPRKDDKVLVGWNALLASSLAQAGCALGRPDWIQEAAATLRFIETHLRDEKGGLLRSHARGVARHPATLEDHGALLEAQLDLYEATFEKEWLTGALRTAEQLQREFTGADGFLVDSQEKDLLFATRVLWDGSTPSASAVALRGWIRLGILLPESPWLQRATDSFAAFSTGLRAGPARSAYALIAFDLLKHPQARVAVHGEDRAAARAALGRKHDSPFLPFAHFIYYEDSGEALLERDDGQASAVVCVGTRCLAPVHTYADLLLTIQEAIRESK